MGGYQSFLTFPLKFKLSLTMMRDVELAEGTKMFNPRGTQQRLRRRCGARPPSLSLRVGISSLFLIVATTVHPPSHNCKNNI